MKIVCPILLSILYLGSANANTYYFSSVSGDDSRTSTQARNLVTPWQTLTKLNSFFSRLKPGDSALFNRGDIFYGNMVIGTSGLPGLPITIGAYGAGTNPVITGFKTVAEWTNLGSNIWESASPVSSLSGANMVVINGMNTPMGRFPNSGYLTYQSFTATSKTSTFLPASNINWTGAVAVIRLHNWIIDNDTILSHSKNTFIHTITLNPTLYNGLANYGFFIQNDSRTLDTANEWHYSSSTKKLRIYSTSSPANVQISTIDTLVRMRYRSYITFDNISFTGSNKAAFVINSCPNLTIQNCLIDYSGQDAIWGGQNWGSPFSPNFRFINSTINHTNNNGIHLANEFKTALIQNSTIKNTALIAGMGKGGDQTYNAIRIVSSNGIIENCIVDSTGYIPIHFRGSNFIIRKNFISNYCMIKMDGGGIYTWVGPDAPDLNIRITNNIIINGIGDLAGTTETTPLIHGIYLDANTANVEVSNNTAANLAYGGLYIYSGSHDNNIHDNTFYNNGRNQMLLTNQFTKGRATVNNLIKHNLFISKGANQYVAVFNTKYTLADFIAAAGTFNNNYYARPIDDNLTIKTVSNNNSTIINNTLAQWKLLTGLDAQSKKSPLTIANANDLRFEYNETSVNKIIYLPFNYVDVKGITYQRTITLAPFTSAVLINKK